MTYQEPDFKVQINTEVLQREIIITNQDEFLQAGDVLKLCKDKIKEVDEERKKYTAPLDEAKKRLMAKAKTIIEPIEAYIDKINKAMSDWILRKVLQLKEGELATIEKLDKLGFDSVIITKTDNQNYKIDIMKTNTYIEFNTEE